MKKRTAALIIVAVFLCLTAAQALASETIRIGIAEAYLLDGPGTGYRILCKVTRGEPLTLLSWEGDWFRVRRAAGMVGWLNRVTLSPEDSARYRPAGGSAKPSGSFLDSIRTGFDGSGDDTLTASAGGRGMIEERGPGGSFQDYQAVRFMESIVIPDEELRQFIASGGLTP